MQRFRFLLCALAIAALFAPGFPTATAETGHSTRITKTDQHRRTGAKSYPYRAKSEYILGELDLQAGDAVVDIGAGDGWWTEKFAQQVGETGVVHAGEVGDKKVAKLKEKFADNSPIKPYLMKSDSTGLPENSCDLAFFSQSYHHLKKDGHVDYLKHLHSVLKPTGRVVIIEKYTETGLAQGNHGTPLSRLVRQAEEAGWVPVRLELMTGTYHYIAILAQQEVFPPEPKKKMNSQKSALPNPADTPTESGHTGDSLELVQKRLAGKTALLIDVREQSEWDAGHLAQAKLVPLSQLRDEESQSGFAENLSKTLSSERTLYLHCRSGGRVLVASPILRKLGYDVRPLKAGYGDLLEAGFAKSE